MSGENQSRQMTDAEVSAFLAWWHATPPESPPDYRTPSQRALDDIAAQAKAMRQYWQDDFRPLRSDLSCSACFDIAPGITALGHELSGSRVMVAVLIRSGRVELLARLAAIRLFDACGLAAALVEMWRVSRVAPCSKARESGVA